MFAFYVRIGLVHLLQSRIDEAIIWLGRARSADPEHPMVRAYLASAHALAGRIERAAAELAEARRLSGDGRFSSIARLRSIGHFGVPTIRALLKSTHKSHSAIAEGTALRAPKETLPERSGSGSVGWTADLHQAGPERATSRR
jgi:hypothetical protein